MTIEEMITDKQLDHAFGNTNFGNTPKRDIVKFALLTFTCGYANGHTAQQIIQELGLISENSRLKNKELSKKGKEYLWACFGKTGY